MIEVPVLGAEDERGDLGAGVDEGRTLRIARTATPAPSGSSATSTQLPLGLLRRLFNQSNDLKSLVVEPFVVVSMRDLSMSQAGWGRLLSSPKQSSARASALAPARDGEDDIAQAVQFS